MANEKRPSLKDFDPYTDRNGQDFGQDSPLDVARPDDLQRELASDPGGEAETARVASGRRSEGATDAVEAEVPRENVDRISNPSLSARPDAVAHEAIDRATASLGEDEEERP